MRNNVIYVSDNGDEYFDNDIKEDSRGNLYLYDEYLRKEISFEEERNTSTRRGAGRSRYNDNSTSRNKDVRGSYTDIPSHIGGYNMESPVVDSVVKNVVSYDDLPTTTFRLVDGISNKGLVNILTDSKKRQSSTYFVAEYKDDSIAIFKQAIEGMLKHCKTLILKPDEVFNIKLTSSEDKFLSSMATNSFEGIRMEGIADNMGALMEYKGQKDPGWKMFQEKLEKALLGIMLVNVYIIPEALVEAIGNVVVGTDAFNIPTELKDKLNIPVGGYMRVDTLIFSVSYNEARLFMVLP